MADKKISELTAVAALVAEDLIPVVDNPNGTPVTKKITVKNLFGSISANTVLNAGALTTFNANATFNNSNTVFHSNTNVSGLLKVTGSGANARLVIEQTKTPGTNNATTEFGGGQQGSIFYDSNYIYVATSNTQIKRVALSVF